MDKIGGFDERMKDGAEDAEFFLRVGLAGFKQQCLPVALYYLGIHSNNMTARYIKEKRFEKAWDYIFKKHNLSSNN